MESTNIEITSTENIEKSQFEIGENNLNNIGEIIDLLFDLRDEIKLLIENKEDKESITRRDELIKLLTSNDFKDMNNDSDRGGYPFIKKEIDLLLDCLYKVKLI